MADSPRLEELRRRVQADPASIAFAALAEEYRRAGKFREAVEASRAGLRYHPTYVSARVTLGRCLVELQEVEQAERELAFVLKSAPDNLAARRALGELCWQQLRFSDALTHFRTAHVLAPGDTELPQILQSLERELAADGSGSSVTETESATAAESKPEAPVSAAKPAAVEGVSPVSLESATWAPVEVVSPVSLEPAMPSAIETISPVSVESASEPVSVAFASDWTGDLASDVQTHEHHEEIAELALFGAQFEEGEAVSFVEHETASLIEHDAEGSAADAISVYQTEASVADVITGHDAVSDGRVADESDKYESAAEHQLAPEEAAADHHHVASLNGRPHASSQALALERLERFYRAILAARARRQAAAHGAAPATPSTPTHGV